MADSRPLLLAVLLASSVLGLLKNEKKNKWKIDEDNNVLVLKDESFRDFLDENKHVFVMFYAPWCGYCKQMMPGYSNLAREMHDRPSPVPLAKVDCTTNRETCDSFGVDGYPTLKFFVRGTTIDFHGRRTEDGIRAFIDRRLQTEVRPLSKVDLIASLKAHSNSALLVVQEESPDQLEALRDVAAILEDVKFFYSVDDSPETTLIGRKLRKFNVFAYRDEDTDVRILSQDEPIPFEQLQKFISDAERPDVWEASEELINDVFNRRVKTAFLFYQTPQDPVVQMFHRQAALSPDSHKYIQVQTTNPYYQGLQDILGHYGHESHSLVTVDFETGRQRKFKLPHPINEPDLESFFRELEHGIVPEHYRSEPVPQKETKPVATIVGTTFEDMVIQSSKVVFLKVYSPNCYHCRELAPIFEQLARDYKDNPNVVLAEFNGRTNETPYLFVQYFPELRLYLPGSKHAPETFDGFRTYDSLKQFLEEGLKKVADQGVAVGSEYDEVVTGKSDSETL